jgi:hypothetical protein
MATELIQLRDGLLVEVQSNPEDMPRQIVASAAGLTEGAMDQARELLLKAVQPPRIHLERAQSRSHHR